MKHCTSWLGLATSLLLSLPAQAAGQPEQAGGAAMRHDGHAHESTRPDNGQPPTAREGVSGWKERGQPWTRQPFIMPVMRRGGRDRMSTGLVEKNIETDVFEVFAPDSSVADARRKVPVEAKGTVIKALPRLGNYYWVTARQEQNGQVTVASTPYYFGEPGPAPTRMLLEQKHELEIIPQPLPREHGSWRESEKWNFLLRFNGQPLANTTLQMETEFGTRTAFSSDDQGVVRVLFPRDFKPAEKTPGQGAHAHGPRRAKFVLAAEHDAGGKHYLTAFNYTYSADADRNRDLLTGVGFGIFGMLLAVPLLRRKKTGNNTVTKDA
jgi:hypothetical protein